MDKKLLENGAYWHSEYQKVIADLAKARGDRDEAETECDKLDADLAKAQEKIEDLQDNVAILEARIEQGDDPFTPLDEVTYFVDKYGEEMSGPLMDAWDRGYSKGRDMVLAEFKKAQKFQERLRMWHPAIYAYLRERE